MLNQLFSPVASSRVLSRKPHTRRLLEQPGYGPAGLLGDGPTPVEPRIWSTHTTKSWHVMV